MGRARGRRRRTFARWARNSNGARVGRDQNKKLDDDSKLDQIHCLPFGPAGPPLNTAASPLPPARSTGPSFKWTPDEEGRPRGGGGEVKQTTVKLLMRAAAAADFWRDSRWPADQRRNPWLVAKISNV